MTDTLLVDQDDQPSWFTRTFSVGDRVILRPSPECLAYDTYAGNLVLDGHPGTIVKIDPEQRNYARGVLVLNHIYQVGLDEPVPRGCSYTMWASAQEMDHLDVESDSDD